MGKPTTKKKKSLNNRTIDSNSRNSQGSEQSLKSFDADTSIFIDLSREIKEEGNQLFQKRNYDGALLRYEKAIKLLPKNHIDIAYLRSNLATCYMYMTPAEYHNAVNECNLALEVAPKYTKALVKRAKCFEALNRLDLACKDVDSVLALEPSNLTALEISERIKKVMEEKGIKLDDKAMISTPDVTVVKERVVKEKHKKKKSHKGEEKVIVELNKSGIVNEQNVKKEEPPKVFKLVFGDDIRFAQMPTNSTVLQLREIVRNRFPSLKSVLIKYKDQEGDLVTITTSEELRLAEESRDPNGSLRLFITEVNPEHEPLFEEQSKESEIQGSIKNFNSLSESGSMRKYEEDDTSRYIDSWIIQFAQMIKNHVGFNSDEGVDLHDFGVKLYSEAMEDTFTSEEAQEIFEMAEGKFQEMAALALFNWGNVHMYRARKRLHLPESASDETIFENVRLSYEWAQEEYTKAGKRYDEAIKIKPDFYESFLALGKQQYEQAKLSWYYAIGSKVDLTTWPFTQVLELFNRAEDNMERGTELWEETEEQRLKKLGEPNKDKIILEKMGLEGLFKDLTNEEAAEQASNMKSQINLLWGALLYERSVFEYKLGLPTWEDCLMVAVEKFKVAGASPTDLAVMIKNHISHETTQEGLGFNIDEIVQAWHEMHDAKKWTAVVPSYRLEPLFRRRVPNLHHLLDQGFN